MFSWIKQHAWGRHGGVAAELSPVMWFAVLSWDAPIPFGLGSCVSTLPLIQLPADGLGEACWDDGLGVRAPGTRM